MKTSAKYLTTFFIVLSVLSATILWLTREFDLSSQSMFADQPNAIWYILMHVGIIMSFFILSSSFRGTIYQLVSFSSIATLAFDLMDFRWLHNITTAILFIIACICLTLYSPNRKLSWVLVGISSLAFISGIIGLLGSSGVFLGEVIAEFLLSIGILLIVWKKDEINLVD